MAESKIPSIGINGIASNASGVTGTFKYTKIGNIVVGAGEMTLTANKPAYSDLVTGLPEASTVVMGAFITDDSGYNTVYVTGTTIKTRSARNSGITLRLSCVYLAK